VAVPRGQEAASRRQEPTVVGSGADQTSGWQARSR